MTKQELWQYTKKTSFGLTYLVLMGLNLFAIYFLSDDLYYEIFDPVYWRDNFTMYPYVEVEIPTSLKDKIDVLLSILLFLIPTIWGNYRLYKKKKGVLWILGFWIWLVVFTILLDFVFHLGIWD